MAVGPHKRDLVGTGTDADLMLVQRGCADLSTYLARIAQAIVSGQTTELAVTVTEGASVSSERALPLLLAQVDAEVGRLRALSNRVLGRQLAQQEAERQEDLDRRRRSLRPVYRSLDPSTGHAVIEPAAPDE